MGNHNAETLGDLYTLKQLSDYTGLAPRTLQKHMKAGKLPYVRLGGSIRGPVRFRPSDVNRWFEGLAVVETPAAPKPAGRTPAARPKPRPKPAGKSGKAGSAAEVVAQMTGAGAGK